MTASTLHRALTVALLADLIHNFGDAMTSIPLGLAFVLRSARGEQLVRDRCCPDDLRECGLRTRPDDPRLRRGGRERPRERYSSVLVRSSITSLMRRTAADGGDRG
jgi:hypothetical protein